MAQMLGFGFTMVTGGNDTTTGLLGGAAELLTRHPEQRVALQEDPSRMRGAVEEFLRLTAPVQGLARMTTADVTIRDCHIPAGRKVMLLYASANRDEDVYAEPDRFDVTRKSNNHLAFGVGEHFCLGTHLARQEIREMFRQLLARMPDIELAGEVQYLRSHFIDGVKHIPVKYTSA